MSIKKNNNSKKHFLSMPHTEPTATELISQKVISWFPSFPREYVVVCVGTDRSTGDALGPLVGTGLSNTSPKHLTVYGTLHQPVHGKNLESYLNKIHFTHRNPFIIAIDACLGKSSSIGNIIANKSPLKPGAALGKNLPMIGNLNITAVVNISGFMEYTVLQNTRLSLVVDLAQHITSILSLIDQQLTFRKIQPAVVATDFQEISAMSKQVNVSRETFK